jgi:hypothetical protein
MPVTAVRFGLMVPFSVAVVVATEVAAVVVEVGGAMTAVVVNERIEPCAEPAMTR